MANFNVAVLAEMKEIFAKAQYVKREWKTAEEDKLTLQQYIELIDNTLLSHISGNPVIIAKERKDGNVFLKMWIPLKEGSGIEYDLSYENDFKEGDEISKDSLCFCVEKFLDKKHGYVTGTVI